MCQNGKWALVHVDLFSFICSPVHIDIHRNFIFDMNMDIYLKYTVITFLVILTYSFLNDCHFGFFFFDLLPYLYWQSQRLPIAYTHVSLLYLYRQMEQCHCDLLSEIYKHILFTYHLNFMCLLPLRLSCVFLANYVPKCQMSSGPYGPIFLICKIILGNSQIA